MEIFLTVLSVIMLVLVFISAFLVGFTEKVPIFFTILFVFVIISVAMANTPGECATVLSNVFIGLLLGAVMKCIPRFQP